MCGLVYMSLQFLRRSLWLRRKREKGREGREVGSVRAQGRQSIITHTIHHNMFLQQYFYNTPNPHSRDEGSFEVVSNTNEQSLPACDHGHASSKMADHVVGCQMHTMDVRVQ